MKWSSLRLRDTVAGYGLISIIAHWLTAIVIIAMLVTGNSIMGSSGPAGGGYLRMHTSIALSAYLGLAFRIYWRVRYGHPSALPTQNVRLVRLAKIVHFIIIGLIAIMMITGPLMAWAGNLPLDFFWFARLPSPMRERPAVFSLLLDAHSMGATLILVLVVGHIGAAMFHIIAFKDRTLDKIILPAADHQAG